jgi:hypothetical protein
MILSELTGTDVEFTTKHGPAAFAIGDRVQFTDTDKKRYIYNGNAGTSASMPVPGRSPRGWTRQAGQGGW